jgi:hypothetical protein
MKLHQNEPKDELAQSPGAEAGDQNLTVRGIANADRQNGIGQSWILRQEKRTRLDWHQDRKNKERRKQKQAGKNKSEKEKSLDGNLDSEQEMNQLAHSSRNPSANRKRAGILCAQPETEMGKCVDVRSQTDLRPGAGTPPKMRPDVRISESAMTKCPSENMGQVFCSQKWVGMRTQDLEAPSAHKTREWNPHRVEKMLRQLYCAVWAELETRGQKFWLRNERAARKTNRPAEIEIQENRTGNEEHRLHTSGNKKTEPSKRE